MKGHKCPPWCHKCPDLKGDVLPVCWGSIHRNDLLACYCSRPHRATRNDDDSAVTWEQLIERITSLEKALEEIQMVGAVDP